MFVEIVSGLMFVFHVLGLIILIGVVILLTEKKQQTELEDGDYEGDRPRPCPRCGSWNAIYVHDMDKCTDCGLIHK